MDSSIRFAAELKHVREVTLMGSARFDYWRRRLDPEGLYPTQQNGRAQLLIISADARFHGVRFRELSVSVRVSMTDTGQPESGAFLLSAFNSQRFFALVERLWFATPYRHGAVELSPELPAYVQCVCDAALVFRAQMGEGGQQSRAPLLEQEDGWEGPVFLPSRGRRRGRVFYAVVRGTTRTYRFDPHQDQLEIHAHDQAPIFAELLESDFMAEQWALRLDAVHARSPSYAEANVPFRAARHVVAVDGAT